MKHLLEVSIRTRHFCRVMLGRQLGISGDLLVSIRTRHFCRVMPDCLLGIKQLPVSFNPHPAFLPGDACNATCACCHQRSFNPHPAFLPGDANIDSLSSR